MDLVERIFAIVFPVFSIIGLGAVYAHFFRPDLKALSTIHLHLFTPALIFATLVKRGVTMGELAPVALAAALIALAPLILVPPIAKMMRISWLTLTPPVMFRNSGNMGLPLALFAFGEGNMPVAITLFVVSMLLHFSLGNWLLNRSAGWRAFVTSPVLWATCLALLVNHFNFKVDPIVLQPIAMLGDVAIPLLLFTLGVRMLEVNWSAWKSGVLGGLLCPVVGLAVTLPYLHFVSFPQMTAQNIILYACLPPAVLNYLFAERYKQEPATVASIVLIGNILSLLTLPIVFWALFS